ncbi:hypothetical protein [Amycolatopsis sp. BJA-103]|uniref:hypothetical protein n=1 Tax=Amycolatopsis sp. BJA-103 TaxID=1911175 RepID=UPI000CA17A12|nr:hypothetical protein [Amycolatopsis sp. BJA-103]AUI58188.1 hypothetical protein BKN51_08090 [Amycolatopsis sp. BJA-103]
MTETPAGIEPGRRFRLETLRDIVQAELAAAGLPVAPGEHPTGTAGAVVTVDLPDLQGVLADWQEHEVLLDASRQAAAECPNPDCETHRGTGG